MNGPELLQENVGRLKSRMGAFFLGSHVMFRGCDLHADLKDMDWVELYVFGITGRRFSAKQLRLLHAIWTYTSYPDARLWNNRVAALAGSTRSTGALGVAAALAMSEAGIFGQGPGMAAYDFFVSARRQLSQGATLKAVIEEELRTNRGIGGFGRPLVAKDERLAPLLALARQTDLDDGPYLRLAFDVDEALSAGRWRMKMNYAAVVPALLLDMGFNRQEHYLYLFPIFLAGMLPCHIEAAQRPEGTLFPLACAHLLYEGKPKRQWRRAGTSGD